MLRMLSSKITHPLHVMCSLIVLMLLNSSVIVDARLVWIPRLDNEKDISNAINDYPTIGQVGKIF